MIDLTSVFISIISIIFVAISVFIIPLIKKELSAKERARLLEFVDIGVAAAQQIYWNYSGEEKKEYVLNFLREHGFDVDDEAVNAAIEAAVLMLHHELEA